MEENWKNVILDGIQYEYQVNSKGLVRSFKNGKITMLKSDVVGNNYVSYALRDPSKSFYKTIRGHRLVAIMFIDNPNNYNEVNHIDGVKHNNDVSNLEWCTHLHNILHSFETRLIVRAKGELCHQYDKGRKVRNKVTGVIYNSVAGAARLENIPRSTLSNMLNGYLVNTSNIVRL